METKPNTTKKGTSFCDVHEGIFKGKGKTYKNDYYIITICNPCMKQARKSDRDMARLLKKLTPVGRAK
jgi:hypothetical protein